jgi:hypothetical protein
MKIRNGVNLGDYLKGTLTSSTICSFLKTPDMYFLLHGTPPSDFGISRRELLLDDLCLTPEMFSLLLSHLITGKLPVVEETRL